jgi:hypothetical protein
MNDRVNVVVPWNSEFEDFYRRRGHAIKPTPHEVSDGEASRRVAAYLFVAFCGLAAVSFALTLAAY